MNRERCATCHCSLFKSDFVECETCGMRYCYTQHADPRIPWKFSDLALSASVKTCFACDKTLSMPSEILLEGLLEVMCMPVEFAELLVRAHLIERKKMPC